MAMSNVYTGKNGKLTLAKVTGPEGDAAGAVFTAYQDPAAPSVARVVNVEVYVQTDLEEFHQIGQRHAVSLHPGDIHIHGKIGRAYISGGLLYLLMGAGALQSKPNEINNPYVQPVFDMTLDLADPAVPANKAELLIHGVKLQNWVQSIPEEGFVMENVTFKALTIDVVDTGASLPSFP